jgi:hypothetical protein
LIKRQSTAGRGVAISPESRWAVRARLTNSGQYGKQRQEVRHENQKNNAQSGAD